jgi:hypothetical protein
LSVERYGKKYSWVAFFELYGYFIINRLVKPEYENTYRVSSVDIDPTFPRKPPKMQLVTDCFFPAYDEDIQEWINSEKNNYLRDIYVSKFDGNRQDWILLNAYLKQKGNNDTRIDIFLTALLVDRETKALLLKLLDRNFLRLYNPEYYYLFGGEIPWSKIIVPENQIEETGKTKIEIQFPYFWYSWESYHSEMNDIGNIPFVSNRIAKSLNLTFDAKTFSYYTEDGQLATKYIWDEYSHFLFIRKELLSNFVRMHNLALILYESGSRYGDFGKTDTKLKPALKDFKSTSPLLTD